MVRDIEHCEITLGRRPRPGASRQGRGVGALIRSGLLSRVSYLRLLPIVAVLAGAGISSAQSLATVVEPRSNTPFPASLMPPGGTTEHRLTGTGLREHVILFIGVHVYAFGLYVDADRARVALAEFAGRSPVELAGDERFYRRLLDHEFAMTLRLVMVRTVAGVDVATRLTTRCVRKSPPTPTISGRWSDFAAISMHPRSRREPRLCSRVRRQGGCQQRLPEPSGRASIRACCAGHCLACIWAPSRSRSRVRRR